MIFKSIDPEDIRNWVFAAEIIAGIFSIIYYRKYNNSFLKYFPYLIWYSIGNEIFAMYYSEHINNNNLVLFNIYKVIEFTFYLNLYRKLVEKSIFKKWILSFMVLYYVALFCNLFIQDFITEYYSNTYFVGAMMTILSIVLFFSEILNSEKIVTIHKHFIFWLSIAVFLLYFTSIPFKVMVNYYQNSPAIPYIYIANFMVVLLFCVLISFGLLWSKAEK